MQMTLSLAYHSPPFFFASLGLLCLLAFSSILQEIYRRAADKKGGTTTIVSTTDTNTVGKKMNTNGIRFLLSRYSV